MPRPEDTEIRIDERGDETHESWLLVRAGRISAAPGAQLFDSEIKHQHFIRVEIDRCSRKRDLNHDWHHGRETIMEFDMSEAQWGAFVSSFGIGSGVPATLNFFRIPEDVPEGLTPQPPGTSRLAESHREVREAGDVAVEKVVAAHAAVMEAFEAKAGRKVMGECLHTLTCMINNAPANMEFAAKSLTEHVEKVVTKARADIEGMALRAQQNNPALTQGSMPTVLTLESPDSYREQRDAGHDV